MVFLDLRDEWSLTEHLRKAARIPPGSPVRKGIGDDCAVYRPRGSRGKSAEDLLFTCDLFGEGIHFLRTSLKAPQAGRRALARSLSDIAAMGGKPQFCLVALCAAEWTDTRWIDGFYKGLLKLADETGTVLAGGDLSHGDRFICDVTVCGSVPRGKALLRSGARVGDEIYVSGLLGRCDYTRLEPRLELGVFLREKLGATAAMDLSDGLSLDLRRLCLASGVSAEIGEPPRFPGATRDAALNGGEDYELLFTVPKGRRVPETFRGLPLTRIGRMVRGRPGRVLLDGIALQPGGYDHFRRTHTVNLEESSL
jgi:thiamine-monophosphate kinase